MGEDADRPYHDGFEDRRTTGREFSLVGEDHHLPKKMLKLATQGGDLILGWENLYRPKQVKASDLVLINGRQLDYTACITDLMSSIALYGANHIVDKTIVNDEIVMDGGRLTRIDEEMIVDQANNLADGFLG